VAKRCSVIQRMTRRQKVPVRKLKLINGTDHQGIFHRVRNKTVYSYFVSQFIRLSVCLSVRPSIPLPNFLQSLLFPPLRRSLFVNSFFLNFSIRTYLSLSNLPHSSPPVFPSFRPFFFFVNLSLHHSSVNQSVSQSLSQLLCLSVRSSLLLSSFYFFALVCLSIHPPFTRPSVRPSVRQSVSVRPIVLTSLSSTLPSLALSSVCQPFPLYSSVRPSVSKSVCLSQSLSVRSSLLLSSVLPRVTLSPVCHPPLISFPRPSDSLSFKQTYSYFERHICRPSDAILQVQ